MYCLEDEKIMLDGLRKVVHIEVYDFDSDAMAYAVDSHKNQFGYKYNVKYLGQKGEIIKEEPEVNNVERGAYYYNKFGINLSQLNSLKRKVKSLTKKKKFIPFPEENGVDAIIRGGSHIHYSGEHVDEFCEQVLGFQKVKSL